MATKKREAHPIISIDDFQPKHTGFVESWKASWQEAGLIATIWLDVVDRDNWRPGHYRRNAYELTYHRGTVSSRALGSIQEETASLLLSELKAQVLAALTDAGWQEVDTTKDDQPIFQYRPASQLRLVPSQEPSETEDQVERDLPDLVLAGAGANVPDEAKPNVTIDDLQPDALRYAAHWIEDGIQVTLHLKARDDDQAQGYLLETWYVGRHASMRALGQKQQALAAQREFQLRHRFQIALEDAGWLAEQKEGGEVWYHSSQRPRYTLKGAKVDEHGEILFDIEVKQPGEAQTDQVKLEPIEPGKPRSHVVEVIGGPEAKERGQQPAYSREVFTRPVTFTCIVCKTTVTQQRFPGNPPLYCSQGCKDERTAAKTRERVARHRERKKAEGNDTSQEPVTKQ